MYVRYVVSRMPGQRVHLSTPVRSITTHTQGKSYVVELTTAAGTKELYDHVILACHSNEALALLREGKGVTTLEKQILDRFRWSRNRIVLHCDENAGVASFAAVTLSIKWRQLMPRNRLAWSSWNYMTPGTSWHSGPRRAGDEEFAL